jgi:hypothetical protein
MCGGGGGGGLLNVLTGGLVGALLGNQDETAKKALEAQQQANKMAQDAATRTADQADQANNRANAKTPDIGGMAAKNSLDAKGGQSGTMLTGPEGIDPNALLLGKKTLLGG